jgi:hypothetical protein
MVMGYTDGKWPGSVGERRTGTGDCPSGSLRVVLQG